MKTFAGKVALVTGSTSGIGRITALAFAARGAFVVTTGLSEADGQETVRLIQEVGGEGLAMSRSSYSFKTTTKLKLVVAL